MPPKIDEKEVVIFQRRLALEHGEVLSVEEARTRLTALVELTKL